MSLPARVGPVLALAALAAGLTSCSSEAADQPAPAADAASGYVQTNLVANWDAYRPQIVQRGLKNAWGISLRPAGDGGHFWITANATGKSFEYVGDVGGDELHTDDLKVDRDGLQRPRRRVRHHPADPRPRRGHPAGQVPLRHR